jgi:hypothetical protein
VQHPLGQHSEILQHDFRSGSLAHQLRDRRWVAFRNEIPDIRIERTQHMYRVGRNDKNGIRKIQIVPKMLAQIGIPLGVIHRSGRSLNPEKTRRDLFRSRRRCGFAAGTRQQHQERQQTEKISQHNAQLQSYGNPRQCQIYEAISGNTLIIDGKRKGPITNTRFDLPG